MKRKTLQFPHLNVLLRHVRMANRGSSGFCNVIKDRSDQSQFDWTHYEHRRLFEQAVGEIVDDVQSDTSSEELPVWQQVREQLHRAIESAVTHGAGSPDSEAIGREITKKLTQPSDWRLILLRLSGSQAPNRKKPATHRLRDGVWLLEPAHVPAMLVDMLMSTGSLSPKIGELIRRIDPAQSPLGPFLHDPLIAYRSSDEHPVHLPSVERMGIPLLSLYDIARLGMDAVSPEISFKHAVLEYLRHRRVSRRFRNEWWFEGPGSGYCKIKPRDALQDSNMLPVARRLSRCVIDLDGESLDICCPEEGLYRPPLLVLPSLLADQVHEELLKAAIWLDCPDGNVLLEKLGHAVIMWTRACRLVEMRDSNEPLGGQFPTTRIREPESVLLFSGRALEALVTRDRSATDVGVRIAGLLSALSEGPPELSDETREVVQAYDFHCRCDRDSSSLSQSEAALTLFAAATRLIWGVVDLVFVQEKIQSMDELCGLIEHNETNVLSSV